MEEGSRPGGAKPGRLAYAGRSVCARVHRRVVPVPHAAPHHSGHRAAHCRSGIVAAAGRRERQQRSKGRRPARVGQQRSQSVFPEPGVVARFCRVICREAVRRLCVVVVRGWCSGRVARCRPGGADDGRCGRRDRPGRIVCGCCTVARRGAGDLFGQGRIVWAQAQGHFHRGHLRRRGRVQWFDGAVLQRRPVPQQQDRFRGDWLRRGRAPCGQRQGRARAGASLCGGLGAADAGGGELHRKHQVLDQGAHPGSDRRQAAGSPGGLRSGAGRHPDCRHRPVRQGRRAGWRHIGAAGHFAWQRQPTVVAARS